MRVRRGLLLVVLLGSAVAAGAFLWAAVAHGTSGDPMSPHTERAGTLAADVVPEPGSSSLGPGGHRAIEWGLWSGFVACVTGFVASMALFRREVAQEKRRERNARARKEFVRQVRDYELARRGTGPNT